MALSCGFIHIEKYRKEQLSGIQVHDQREHTRSKSNPDIDFSKSSANYDFKNEHKISYPKAVKERIQELDLKRATRKNAIFMCQGMVTVVKNAPGETPDNGFFDSISQERQREFFRQAYEWAANRFGPENMISAIVHLDEQTPHMHFNFVPVTPDGRLSAKDVFRGLDSYSKLQDSFYRDVCRDFGLERGEKRDERREHLKMAEYKIKTGWEEVKRQSERLTEKRDAIEREEQKLQEQIGELKDAAAEFNAINSIKVSKSLLGDKVIVFEDDYKRLSDSAKLGAFIKYVDGEREKLQKQIEKVEKGALVNYKQRAAQAKRVERLEKAIDKFEKFIVKRGLRDEFLDSIKPDADGKVRLRLSQELEQRLLDALPKVLNEPPQTAEVVELIKDIPGVKETHAESTGEELDKLIAEVVLHETETVWQETSQDPYLQDIIRHQAELVTIPPATIQPETDSDQPPAEPFPDSLEGFVPENEGMYGMSPDEPFPDNLEGYAPEYDSIYDMPSSVPFPDGSEDSTPEYAKDSASARTPEAGEPYEKAAYIKLMNERRQELRALVIPNDMGFKLPELDAGLGEDFIKSLNTLKEASPADKWVNYSKAGMELRTLAELASAAAQNTPKIAEFYAAKHISEANLPKTIAADMSWLGQSLRRQEERIHKQETLKTLLTERVGKYGVKLKDGLDEGFEIKMRELIDAVPDKWVTYNTAGQDVKEIVHALAAECKKLPEVSALYPAADNKVLAGNLLWISQSIRKTEFYEKDKQKIMAALRERREHIKELLLEGDETSKLLKPAAALGGEFSHEFSKTVKMLPSDEWIGYNEAADGLKEQARAALELIKDVPGFAAIYSEHKDGERLYSMMAGDVLWAANMVKNSEVLQRRSELESMLARRAPRVFGIAPAPGLPPEAAAGMKELASMLSPDDWPDIKSLNDGAKELLDKLTNMLAGYDGLPDVYTDNKELLTADLLALCHRLCQTDHRLEDLERRQALKKHLIERVENKPDLRPALGMGEAFTEKLNQLAKMLPSSGRITFQDATGALKAQAEAVAELMNGSADVEKIYDRYSEFKLEKGVCLSPETRAEAMAGDALWLAQTLHDSEIRLARLELIKAAVAEETDFGSQLKDGLSEDFTRRMNALVETMPPDEFLYESLSEELQDLMSETIKLFKELPGVGDIYADDKKDMLVRNDIMWLAHTLKSTKRRLSEYDAAMVRRQALKEAYIVRESSVKKSFGVKPAEHLGKEFENEMNRLMSMLPADFVAGLDKQDAGMLRQLRVVVEIMSRDPEYRELYQERIEAFEHEERARKPDENPYSAPKPPPTAEERLYAMMANDLLWLARSTAKTNEYMSNIMRQQVFGKILSGLLEGLARTNNLQQLQADAEMKRHISAKNKAAMKEDAKKRR